MQKAETERFALFCPPLTPDFVAFEADERYGVVGEVINEL
jgi:hypothetical protein